MIAVGFDSLYYFSSNKTKDVSQWQNFNAYIIKCKNENVFTGTLDYPIPVSFAHFSQDKNEFPAFTSNFFIEKGKISIDLPKFKTFEKVKVNSPTNNEYQIFRKALSSVYKTIHFMDMEKDSYFLSLK